MVGLNMYGVSGEDRQTKPAVAVFIFKAHGVEAVFFKPKIAPCPPKLYEFQQPFMLWLGHVCACRVERGGHPPT